MQNKGLIKFIAIVLAIACAYQLSFTVVSSIVEGKAEKYAEEQVAATTITQEMLDKEGMSENAYREYLLVKKEQHYLDSVKSKPVYNVLVKKFTFAEVKEKEINLGLDLRGGMNVMLEIAVEDVVKALSNDSKDPIFLAAIEDAKVEAKNSQSDFITLFAKSYNRLSNGAPLSIIFNNQMMKDKVSLNSTNDEVISVLREESESAIANSYNVLRSRIDRFGVAQPNIQRMENSGRILVELPGVKEPERVRKLLQGTASLEFWATYDNDEVLPQLQRVNNVLRDLGVNGAVVAEEKAAEGDLVAELEGAAATDAELAAYNKANPLFAKLMPAVDMTGRAYRGPVVGHAMTYDMETIDEYLAMPQIGRAHV